MNGKNSFNSGADIYNKSRPDYPEEIIRFLIKNDYVNDKMKILEIGAGTGKSTPVVTGMCTNLFIAKRI